MIEIGVAVIYVIGAAVLLFHYSEDVRSDAVGILCWPLSFLFYAIVAVYSLGGLLISSIVDGLDNRSDES